MSEYINNQTRRQEALKAIIQKLHAGKTADDVRDEFAALLADVSGDDIMQIEAALIAEGLPPEDIQPLCDVHVSVFRGALDQHAESDTIPGHPIFTFRAENLAVGRVLDGLQAALADMGAQPGDASLEAARAALRKLREYERHYLRKENLLFPYLERHGFAGPSKVMWGVHDEIRKGWKALEALLTGGPAEDWLTFAAQAEATFAPVAQAIRDMVYKEQKILFPAALERLDMTEWAAIRAQEDEIGYCYIRPGRQWQPGTPPEALAPVAAAPTGGVLPLNVGALTLEQISLMLTALPVDVTFVDEHDTVRFFSQGKDRIFPRSPAIIGRQVQLCHPPQSVHRVQQILDDFRAGLRDVAEFWIQMHGMFVHIRYFALRDAAGGYRGTLEVTQNLTPLRALEGERRLLDDQGAANG